MPNIAPLIFVATLMFCVLSGVTLLAHIYNLNNIKAKPLEMVSMVPRGGPRKLR